MDWLPTVGRGVGGCIGMTTWLMCSPMAWNQMKRRLILLTVMTTTPWAVTTTSPTVLSEERYGKWSEQFDKKATSPPHIDGSVLFARWRQCAPASNTCFLDPPESSSQTTSWLVQPFFSQLTVESSYTLQWATSSSSKLPMHMCDLDTPLSNVCAHPSSQMASQSGLQCLQGLQAWQTDHATPSVTRPHQRT